MREYVREVRAQPAGTPAPTGVSVVTMSAQETTPRIRLAPSPSAARAARAFVADVLQGWPAATVETTRLLVSELVTNAVLYARSTIEVSVSARGRLRVEVGDSHPSDPVPKNYELDADTGRGLALLVSLAEEWGVERTATGKTVWFVVANHEDGRLAGDAAQARPEGVVPRHDVIERAGGPAGDVEAGTVPLAFDGVAIGAFDEMSAQLYAVMRELALIAEAPRTPGERAQARPKGLEPGVTARLLELWADVRSAFSIAGPKVLLEEEAARRRGDRTFTMHIAVSEEAWRKTAELWAWIAEIDRLCDAGELLTLGSSEEVRRLRRSMIERIRASVPIDSPDPSRPA